jgi:hypothetical protein
MLIRKGVIWSSCVLLLMTASVLHAGHKRQAPVPPGLEIEILDPGVDPVGNPAVVTTPDAGGQLKIDIPQTILVHRYYYTGDRKFQGPMLPGGPAIVVVSHPQTGERLYLEMQMLPGAPRVIYTSKSIEYDYGKQGITLYFDSDCRGKPCCNPKVVYRNCTPVARQVANAAKKVAKAVHHVAVSAGVTDLASKIKDETKNLGNAAVDGVKTVGKAVITPVVQIVEMLPGVKTLQSSAEQRAAVARDEAVQRAGTLSARANDSISTLR